MPATQRMTADEYLALPYSEERRWVQLVEGEHVSRPYPVPRLAVEVRSPSTWRYDIGPKKAAYERAGLRELWLVDTAASEVLIFRRSEPDAPAFDVALELERSDTLTSPQLGGFELPLVELFPE
jgi:Uma2 family endonuclease